MGQRHQIYLRIKDMRTKKPVVVGVHHQWCYGQTALMLLANMLTFIKTVKKSEFAFKYTFQDINESQKSLAAAYSIVPNKGYFHWVHPLTLNTMTSESQATHNPVLPGPETIDPRLGDNNDGITIIDLTGSEVKYCFLSVSHLEGNSKDEVKNFVPYSAHEYLKHYYPKYKTETKNEAGRDCTEFHAESKQYVQFLNQFEVLTKDEVKKIFPAMFKKQKSYDDVATALSQKYSKGGK